MKVFVTTFWLPKRGNTQEEYEDAFFPESASEQKGGFLCFAAADGASESMFSGKWAEILVKTFCRSMVLEVDINDFLKRAYVSWNSWKANYLHMRKKQNQPIQWFEQPGMQAGAFSALLGLRLTSSNHKESGKWKDSMAT